VVESKRGRFGKADSRLIIRKCRLTLTESEFD
jgi:hypothetical protein